jgi:hypothetical protein
MKPYETFTPKITKDGALWCALYGDNLHDGISGFGLTPFLAVMAFDEAFSKMNGTSHVSPHGECK